MRGLLVVVCNVGFEEYCGIGRVSKDDSVHDCALLCLCWNACDGAIGMYIWADAYATDINSLYKCLSVSSLVMATGDCLPTR